MRLVGFCLALVLVGCQPAEERCRKIQSAGLSARISAGAERDFQERLFDTPGFFALSSDSQAAVQRGLRARAAQDLRRYLDSSYRADGGDPDQRRRVIGDTNRALDSLDPQPTPPPRPSDLRWYEEHCWEGKPR